jgi:hypothetical protein
MNLGRHVSHDPTPGTMDCRTQHLIADALGSLSGRQKSISARKHQPLLPAASVVLDLFVVNEQDEYITTQYIIVEWGERTKDDFTAVQYTYKLVPRCLVMVDLEQLFLPGMLVRDISEQTKPWIPCCANMRKPLLPSPSGTSRCFSSIQPNKAIRWASTRSRSRSSVVICLLGTARTTCGVNVLLSKVNYKTLVWAGEGVQLIKLVHYQLFHAFHSIVEFCIRCIPPDIAVSHLF